MNTDRRSTGNRTPLILVVDDMPQNIQAVTGILRNEGLDYATAMNGEQALAAVEQYCPDLILLDIQMPEPDGFEVCRRLQDNEATRDIPVIFLTARSSSEDIVRGLQLGAVDYITKPFQQAELLLRVRNHLELKYTRECLQRYNEELEEKVQERTAALQVAMENEREFKNLHTKFIATVSHQFRTPMTSILLNADLFLRSMQKGTPFPAEKVSGMFSETVSAVQRMMTMLDSNAKFLNIETLILTDPLLTFNLLEFCRHMVHSFRNQESARQPLRIRCDEPEPFVVTAQPFVVEAALHELLKNASRYSPVDSEIVLDIRRCDGGAQIRVIDRGRGVREDERESIFELFRRGHHEESVGNVPGLGIGLAIARVCMQQVMKGRVWCEAPDDGVGAVFVLELPGPPPVAAGPQQAL